MALPRIQNELGVKLLEFEGRYVLTKQMVANYYDVDIRTVENCLSANEDELRHNGYFLCCGNSLKEFKLRFAPEIDFGSNLFCKFTIMLSQFMGHPFFPIPLLAHIDKAIRNVAGILLRRAMLGIILALCHPCL